MLLSRHNAEPSSSLTASRSATSSAAEASSRLRASSSIGRPARSTRWRSPCGQREAVDQAGGDAVAAVGDDRRAEPVVPGRGRVERADAVDDRVGRRGGRRSAAGLDHRAAALGHRRDVGLGEPGRVGDHLGRGLAADPGVLVVGILGVAVVAPDRHPRDRADRARRPSSPAARRRGSGRAGSSRTSGRRGPSARATARSGSWCCTGWPRSGRGRSGPAASLIALPWPVKIGLLARIRSARDMPFLPRQAADQDHPVGRLRTPPPALSVALTSARSGKAQSSSSISVPPSAGKAGVISSNCRATG